MTPIASLAGKLGGCRNDDTSTLAVLAIAFGIHTFLGVCSILDGSPQRSLSQPSSTTRRFQSESTRFGRGWRDLSRT